MSPVSRSHRLPFSATLIAGIASLACATSPFEQRQDALAAAEARWRANALTDYSFDFHRGCECLTAATRPVTVTVRRGEFASLTYADSGTVADTTLFRDVLTVDRLFAYLHGVVQGRPATFVATYDERLGYPKRVDIDYSAQAADDELYLRVPILRFISAL